MKVTTTIETKYNIGDRVVYNKYGHIYQGIIDKIELEGTIRSVNTNYIDSTVVYWVNRDNYDFNDLVDDEGIMGLESDVKLQDEIIKLNNLLSTTKDKVSEIKEAINDYVRYNKTYKIKALKEKYGEELE